MSSVISYSQVVSLPEVEISFSFSTRSLQVTWLSDARVAITMIELRGDVPLADARRVTVDVRDAPDAVPPQTPGYVPPATAG